MEIRKYIGELWKPIRGYVGLYEVSNFGRVRSLTRIVFQQKHFHKYEGRILVPCVAGGGYLKVMLYKDNKAKQFFVHRLVAATFIPNPKHLPEVNHRDENITNNRLSNLEWCTAKYNSNYGTIKERISKANGKIVLQFTTDGVFVKQHDSIAKAARQIGCTLQNISICCRGINKTACGFIWKYGKQIKNNIQKLQDII